MAAKVSQEMTEARRLVTECNVTPYAAAKRAGITRSAIYMSAWYKAWRVENAKVQSSAT